MGELLITWLNPGGTLFARIYPDPQSLAWSPDELSQARCLA
jgi:hypothetical protein